MKLKAIFTYIHQIWSHKYWFIIIIHHVLFCLFLSPHPLEYLQNVSLELIVTVSHVYERTIVSAVSWHSKSFSALFYISSTGTEDFPLVTTSHEPGDWAEGWSCVWCCVASHVDASWHELLASCCDPHRLYCRHLLWCQS